AQEVIFFDGNRLDALEEFSGEALSTKPPLDEERLFDWTCAAALVVRSMEALSEEYSGGPRARIFAELRPFLTGGVGLPTAEQAAARLGVPVETLRSHLSRLRGRYRALLRAEVLRTVPQER